MDKGCHREPNLQFSFEPLNFNFKTACRITKNNYNSANDDQFVNSNLCSGSHQQKEYHPSLWSILLHQVGIVKMIRIKHFYHHHRPNDQVPHVNITFHRLADENFKPDSELYLESLGIIG